MYYLKLWKCELGCSEWALENGDLALGSVKLGDWGRPVTTARTIFVAVTTGGFFSEELYSQHQYHPVTCDRDYFYTVPSSGRGYKISQDGQG